MAGQIDSFDNVSISLKVIKEMLENRRTNRVDAITHERNMRIYNEKIFPEMIIRIKKGGVNGTISA